MRSGQPHGRRPFLTEPTPTSIDAAAAAELRNGQAVNADPRARNAEFWARDDVRGARNAMDVWASCKHARFSGVGVHVPTLEAIFEHPRAETEYLDEIRGLRMIEEFAARTSTIAPDALPRLIELEVDWALRLVRAESSAVALMLTLYPRIGPYQRPEYSGRLKDPVAAIVRAFRPSEVTAIAGGVLGPAVQKRLDAALHQVHKEIVLEVAHVAGMAPEVFEREILRIRVPKPDGPKNKRKDK
jgi:hypothetical protein